MIKNCNAPDTLFICKIRSALNNEHPQDSHLRSCIHYPPWSECSRADGEFCDQRIVREVRA